MTLPREPARPGMPYTGDQMDLAHRDHHQAATAEHRAATTEVLDLDHVNVLLDLLRDATPEQAVRHSSAYESDAEDPKASAEGWLRLVAEAESVLLAAAMRGQDLRPVGCTYSLAEVRSGSACPPGARFALVSTS